VGERALGKEREVLGLEGFHRLRGRAFTDAPDGCPGVHEIEVHLDTQLALNGVDERKLVGEVGGQGVDVRRADADGRTRAEGIVVEPPDVAADQNVRRDFAFVEGRGERISELGGQSIGQRTIRQLRLQVGAGDDQDETVGIDGGECTGLRSPRDTRTEHFVRGLG